MNRKKVFCCLLDRKLAFLDYRNIHSKKSKNLHGVSLWFWSNICINRKEVFFSLLYRKLAFVDYKSIDSKKSNNGFLPKGLVNGFGQKLDISSFLKSLSRFWNGKLPHSKMERVPEVRLKNNVSCLLHIKTRILDIIWPCLLIIMIMTWLFSGILFICALVVSFAALARHYSGANKQYSLKKSCYSLILSMNQ